MGSAVKEEKDLSPLGQVICFKKVFRQRLKRSFLAFNVCQLTLKHCKMTYIFNRIQLSFCSVFFFFFFSSQTERV